MCSLIQGPCQLRFSAENERQMKAGAASWWNFPPTVGTICHGNLGPAEALWGQELKKKDQPMFGRLAGAFLGRRLAGSNSGVKGAALGYGVAALARRGLGPLGLALGLGWGAKKLYDRRKSRSSSFPDEATPSSKSS